MANTTADKLQGILNSKNAIKTLLAQNGIDSSVPFSQYSQKVSDLANIGSTYPLPTQAKTYQMKTGTSNVSVTPYIKILDASFNSYTVDEWHADASARGFEKDGVPRPIGLDIRACGKHFYYYFKCKYTDYADYTPKVYATGNVVRKSDENKTYRAKQSTSSTWVDSEWDLIDSSQFSKTYYDVTGTTPITTGGIRHSAWQHPLIAGNYTKYDAVTDSSAYAVVSGNTITLSTTNSPVTWEIKTNAGGTNAFKSDNIYDRVDALVKQTEWFRHRAAIDSGITTSAEPGSVIKVDILNVSGTRPQAGDPMYFWINGTNTNILAKYNISGTAAATGIFNSDNLTAAIATAIYDKQVLNGVNMNDSVENNATRPVLTEGCKGAEAYSFNGKWYITTPMISRANGTGTSLYSADYNIPDSPAIYYSLWMKEFLGRNDIVNPTERHLLGVYFNIATCINSIISYLNANNGEKWGIQPLPTGDWSWTGFRYSANNAWTVYLSNGYVNLYTTNNRYAAPCVSALD